MSDGLSRCSSMWTRSSGGRAKRPCVVPEDMSSEDDSNTSSPMAIDEHLSTVLRGQGSYVIPSEGMAKVRQFKVQSPGRRRHSPCGISTTSHHGFCRTLTASLNFKIKYTMSVFPSKNTGICVRHLYNELYIQSTC